jgi:hypothetical protein
MTLGNYGNKEPETCNEKSPVDSLCRACSLSCPDPTNCYECKRKTMCQQTTPEIREIPDTAGKPYIACNACHLLCKNPDNCNVCRRKMILPGVL